NDAPVIAVIDTGYNIRHPDLKGRLYVNNNDPFNGKDDDNNGYADDEHGWSFVTNSPNVNDGNAHGTHCSGTVAADNGAKKGLYGVYWAAKILPIQILNAEGRSN